MPAKPTLPQTPKDDNRIALINAWRCTTSETIEELCILRAWLNSWLTWQGPVEIELLLQLTGDLTKVKLGVWLFENKPDWLQLVELLTEVDNNAK